MNTLKAPPVISPFVRLSNLAKRPRRAWVDVVIPLAQDEGIPLLHFNPSGTSEMFPAVRGKKLGRHGVRYHVAMAFTDGGQTVTGVLRSLPTDPTPTPFAPSPWASDDILANLLVPIVRIKDANGVDVELRGSNPKLEMLDFNPACQSWRVTHILPGGFVAKGYYKVYSMQDAVEVVGWHIRWSDRTDQEWETSKVQGIAVEVGEYFKMRCAAPWGASPPMKAANGNWVYLLSGPRVFGDAEVLGPYYGHILCTPNKAPDIIGILKSDLNRLNDLLAFEEGGTRGVSVDWDGNWLAFKHTPELPSRSLQGDLEMENNLRWWGFLDAMTFAGDMWDSRPLGMAKTAGQAGGQYDFGASKGGPATTGGDPRHIEEMRFSVTDYFRSVMQAEEDGEILKFDNHPGWRTWSGRSHPENGDCTDILGKRRDRPYSWGSSGYSGLDNQHRSQNNLIAYYALTGDECVLDLLLHYVETDRAMHLWHLDATRACGRLLLTWADMFLVLPDAQAALIEQRAATHLALMAENWLGRKFEGDPVRTVRVFDLAQDPTIGLDKNVWAVWQHSLLAIGCRAAWNVWKNQTALRIGHAVSETIVKHGVVKDFSNYHCAVAVVYPEGENEGIPLTAAQYFQSDPLLATMSDGWWSWIMPGVLIYRDFQREFQALNPQMPVSATLLLADAIVAQVLPTGPESWLDAEWYACSDGVRPAL